MKYIKIEWPEIQDYMEHEDYKEECYFDSTKNVWFIPEDWLETYSYWDDTESWGDIGDLDDAMG